MGNALDRPLEGPPLVEMARGRGSATVVVPDATRKASLPDVLPVVLDRLRQAGIEETGITVLVANGTHPASGTAGLAQLLGSIPSSVNVLEHDSRSSDLVRVGELRPGIPVHLHRSAVETDCLITLGTVRHHYFAGFGGGPKMVFPGIAGYREIQANHGLVLDISGDRPVRHPGCEPGVLDGNPVADEIHRTALLRPPDLSLCLVEGREGGVAWATAGAWADAFDSVVERVRSWFEVSAEPRFDFMVAGGGGAPADTTLIQAHKALDAACRFLEPDGELLWMASLDGGLGSAEMTPFVDEPQPAAILDRLADGWVQYGHTTLRILEKTQRHRVHLHSCFDSDTAIRLGFEPIVDPESVVNRWREQNHGARVGVMAAGNVFPRLAGP